MRRLGRDRVATRLYLPEALSWEQWQDARRPHARAAWSAVYIAFWGLAVWSSNVFPSLQQSANKSFFAPTVTDLPAFLAGLGLSALLILYPAFLSLWRRAHYLCRHPQPRPAPPSLDIGGREVDTRGRLRESPVMWSFVALVIGLAFLWDDHAPGRVPQRELALALGLGAGLLTRLSLWFQSLRLGRNHLARALYMRASELTQSERANGVRVRVLLVATYLLGLVALPLAFLGGGRLDLKAFVAVALLSNVLFVYPAETALWARARQLCRLEALPPAEPDGVAPTSTGGRSG